MARLGLAFDLLSRGADKAASDVDHVGNSAEKTGHKVKQASGNMRLLASTFTSSSNQALGPLQEIADKFDVIQRAGEQATTKVGGRLLGIGAAGLGAGAFLSTLASREKGAQQQLQAAIEALGKSYEDFAPHVEAATKSGERFGNQASTTLDALNRLTLTTHDPALAMKDLGYAIDVAAAKHVPLQKAAEIVGLVFNGSTRAGKQFGLQLENTTGAVKGLAAAQAASKTANDGVVTAQQNYNDKLAVYDQSVSHTLPQQLALYRSHQDVATAQDKAAAAALRLKDAQQKAADAAGAGQRNVEKLNILHGQGAAQADTFAGHLRALGARIEDTAGKFGEEYGSAINTVSLGTIAIGSLIELGLLPKLRALMARIGLTGTAFETLRDVEVATSAEGAAAVEAASANEVLALEGVGAAGVTAGAEVGAGFTAMLGPIGIATAAVIGFLKLLDDAAKNPLTGKNALAGTPSATIALPKQSPVINFDGQQYAANGSGQVLPTQNNDDANRSGRSDPLNRLPTAGNDNADRAGRHAAAATPKPPHVQTFEEWMKAMGLKEANAQAAAAAADAAKAAKQAAVDAATAIRDSIRTQFEAAKSILTEALNQSKQLRESIAGSIQQGSEITDVFGTGPNLNGNHAFGSGQNFNAVKRFFEDRLTKLKRFAAELSALVHKGLDPAEVAKIAQAGLDSGGRLADALSGSSKGELGQIDSVTRQINAISDSTGKRISDVQFKAQIAHDKQLNDALAKRLDEANKHLKVIAREKPGQGAVDQRAQAFLLGA